jgi:hypothetical protein
MATLSLHVDESGRTALLRRGWSWLAVLALPLWALHRQLWIAFVPLCAAVALLHLVALLLIDLASDETVAGLLALGWLAAWSAACGMFANRLHARLLQRAGYREVAVELRR